jgi:hypothetical protein
MNVFGYIGKVLHIDLGSEQFKIKDIERSITGLLMDMVSGRVSSRLVINGD